MTSGKINLINKKKNCHGTQRALQNDLLMALHSCCSVILLMLDLSATFDTICHSIPHYLTGLASRGKVLEWFESYLLRRRQAVVVNASSSFCPNQPPSLDRSCLAWALCVICRLRFVTLRRCEAVFFPIYLFSFARFFLLQRGPITAIPWWPDHNTGNPVP